MKLSTFLIYSFISVAVSWASNSTLTVAEIVKSLPSCALPCALDVVQMGACDFNQLGPCLCTNITLQAQLSICVQQSCDFNDQKVAAVVEQEICQGYPQETRAPYLTRTTVTLFCVVLPFLFLRLFSRWHISGRLWSDDWAAFAAMLLIILGATLEIVAAKRGFGKHYWTIDVNEEPVLLKIFFAVQVIYIIVQVAAKISILLLYFRLFPDQKFKMQCKLAMAFVVLHGLIFALIVVFQCSPVSANWDLTLKRKCLDIGHVGIAGAAFSIFEDIVLLVMPLPQLNTLQIGLFKRVSLMLMLSVGSFACITSMIRLKYLAAVGNSYDSTWDDVDILVWSSLEVDVTLICSCIPAFRPLLLQYVPSLYRSAMASRKSTGYKMRMWKPSVSSSTDNDNYTGLTDYVDLSRPETARLATDSKNSRAEVDMV